jgi:hypothetical protein
MSQRRKRLIKYSAIIVFSAVALFYLVPIVLNAAGGSYNRYRYKSRIEQSKNKKPVSYYLSSTGDDSNDGKSFNKAWKTINRLNKTELHAGDSVLFEANKDFVGNVEFDENDFGIPGQPITITSYGVGKATISAGNGTAIKISNTQGYHLTNLNLKGSGAEKNTGSGIAVINSLRGDIKLESIVIDSIEAMGFGYWGILVDGNRKKSGFRNVTVQYCDVHDNGDAGLYVYGDFDTFSKEYAHEDVTIRNVTAYNNAGRRQSKTNTGSGIVLSDVRKGVIEKCKAYNNGALCFAEQGGPVGIWAWDSDNILIQYNESFDNKTAGKKDGGGFDFDGGVTNSVMQYNYSHNNDGAGFFLAQFTFARKSAGNIIRYNFSYGDGRKNSYAGLDIWGAIENSYIYNNTVITQPSLSGTPAAIHIWPNEETNSKAYPSSIFIANNILVSSANTTLLNVPKGVTGVKFINNNYYSTSNDSKFIWYDKVYSSFAEWYTATGQEKDGKTMRGFSVDPKFKQAGYDLASNTQLNLIELAANSPMIDAGIDVSKQFRLNKTADEDLHGNKIPQHGRFDIGASEFTHLKLNNE